jgi:hypothetical protein
MKGRGAMTPAEPSISLAFHNREPSEGASPGPVRVPGLEFTLSRSSGHAS